MKRVKEGTFPAPISLGDRAVGWLEHELDAWIKKLVLNNRPENPNAIPGTRKI